jgi:antitoxin component YwqK of YwqJK toxin-antitoxin module
MRYRSIILILIAGLSISSTAQVSDTINITDIKGLKQGHWIKKDRNGQIQYDGYFKDDIPTGTFKRFHNNGKLQSLLIFSGDGKSADAEFYHLNGLVSSKGKYINQLKEGKWQFFSSAFEDYLISEDEYKNNRKNGLSVKYFPNKNPSEKLTYVNDVRTGEWLQYYSSGKIFIRATFADDKLQGKYSVYFENGNPEYLGQYKDDARDGTWLKYNREGIVITKINYIKGLATDPEIYRKETKYLDSLERFKGKIADPEKTGTIW